MKTRIYVVDNDGEVLDQQQDAELRQVEGADNWDTTEAA